MHILSDHECTMDSDIMLELLENLLEDTFGFNKKKNNVKLNLQNNLFLDIERGKAVMGQ